MARPGARGLRPGLSLKYEIVLRAGPGLDIMVEAGPGPGLIIQFAGRARAGSAQLLRGGPGPQIIFLGLDFRPVQGPSLYHSIHCRFICVFKAKIASDLGQSSLKLYCFGAQICQFVGPYQYTCSLVTTDVSIFVICSF